MDKGTTNILSTIIKVAGIMMAIAIIIFFFYSDKIAVLLFGKYSTENGFFIFCGGVFIFIIIGLILFGANYLVKSSERTQRKDLLQKLAQQQGWKFEPQQHLAFLPELAKIIGLVSDTAIQKFFDNPHPLTGTSTNVLQGQVSGRNFVACDQYYWTSGENPQQITQTLIGIEINGANFPFFGLFPKSSVGKFFGAVLDYNNPSLPKEFTDKYRIECQNSVYFNQFLNSQICDFYLKQSVFSTVCGGKYLVIYHLHRVLSPQEILDRLKFIEGMANLFVRSGNFR